MRNFRHGWIQGPKRCPQDTASFSTPCPCLPLGRLPFQAAPSTESPQAIVGRCLISPAPWSFPTGRGGLFNKSLTDVPRLLLFGLAWGQAPPGISPGASGVGCPDWPGLGLPQPQAEGEGAEQTWVGGVTPEVVTAAHRGASLPTGHSGLELGWKPWGHTW